MTKVLFICEGNMMRSQMAEAFYNRVTNTQDAVSAGATAETKDHISPRTIEVMNEVGIDMSHARPNQVDQKMVDEAERVIYFPSDYMPDYVKDNKKAELWDVVDPHYHKEKGMQLVREVRDDIRERVNKIVEESGNE
jgi:arsenate reductase